jgi:hypothetical protein
MVIKLRVRFGIAARVHISPQQFSVTRSCNGSVKAVALEIALSTYSSPRTSLLTAIPARYLSLFIGLHLRYLVNWNLDDPIKQHAAYPCRIYVGSLHQSRQEAEQLPTPRRQAGPHRIRRQRRDSRHRIGSDRTATPRVFGLTVPAATAADDLLPGVVSAIRPGYVGESPVAGPDRSGAA